MTVDLDFQDHFGVNELLVISVLELFEPIVSFDMPKVLLAAIFDRTDKNPRILRLKNWQSCLVLLSEIGNEVMNIIQAVKSHFLILVGHSELSEWFKLEISFVIG